jgi:hypothetical protein
MVPSSPAASFSHRKYHHFFGGNLAKKILDHPPSLLVKKMLLPSGVSEKN